MYVVQVRAVQRGRVVGDCISHCVAPVAEDQTVGDGLQAVLCSEEENAGEKVKGKIIFIGSSCLELTL